MNLLKKIASAALAVMATAACAVAADFPIRSAELTKVRVTGGFWLPRIETNRLVTLKADFEKCGEVRIPNITNAAARAWGTFRGCPFDDSDVYKVMEGAAYIQATDPDPDRAAFMDGLIAQVAAAQETDGYLYTARTLGFTYPKEDAKRHPFGMMGPTRWSKLGTSHELYNVGHLYEAAVAWQAATGRTNLLAVAEKSADLLCRTFGWGEDQLKDTSGHEEVELALCKLYRATGRKRYLDLAKFFIDVRGRADVRPNLRGPNQQDHRPVCEQTEAIGHAVRAAYLYCGVADVAALTGDGPSIAAIERIWENVVSKKLHLTGGIGARASYRPPEGGARLGEAFTFDYDLPNEDAYLETCAAIGNALWNERMFRWKGEAKYVDVLERTLYNGFLSGIALTGDEFFYPNPLANKAGLGHSKGAQDEAHAYHRSKWFGCSCCPVNVVRFIPQVPTFAYATDGKAVYWNLFIESEAELDGVKLVQKTDYPWSGAASLEVTPAKDGDAFALKVRIPGWARGRPVPSDLYVQTKPSSEMELSVSVNGLAVNGVAGADGYLSIARAWKRGDVVTVDIPMPVKRIRAHAKVASDAGRLAVECGPIVYCAEGADNGGSAFDAVLPEDATFARTTVTVGDRAFPALKASTGLVLVPYFLWDHRAPGNEMQVWLRER